MTSPASLSTASLRIQHLNNFSLAIQNRKGRTAAFDALDPQDRARILAKLRISRFDWTTIEKKGLKGRIQSEIVAINKALSSSAPDKLPMEILALILHMAGETPARIERVCKQFQKAQKISYMHLLATYVGDPRMKPFIGDLNLDLIKKMPPGVQAKCVKMIYQTIHWGARETALIDFVKTKQKQGLAPLNLGQIAEKVQWIRDQDLIILFDKILLTLRNSHQISIKEYPDFLDLIDHDTRSAAIRLWIRQHPEVVARITVLDLQQSALETLSPEIRYLTNLTSLELEDNTITLLPKEIGSLTKLTSLGLTKNRLQCLPRELAFLVLLQELHLCQNQLTDFPWIVLKLENLKHLCLADNKIRKIPPALTGLKKLEFISANGNLLSFSSNAYFLLFRELIERKIPLADRDKYYKQFNYLLREAFKKRRKMPIQDAFSQLIETIEDGDLRILFREMMLWMKIYQLEKMSRPENVHNIIPDSQDLPKSTRYRIYAFTQLLEKQKGTLIDHANFGRMAFRNEGRQISDPFIRSKAIQLAIIEIVFIHFPVDSISSILSSPLFRLFNKADDSIIRPIYAYLTEIETEAGRAKNHPRFGELAFRRQGGFDAPNSSRVEAVKRYFKALDASSS